MGINSFGDYTMRANPVGFLSWFVQRFALYRFLGSQRETEVSFDGAAGAARGISCLGDYTVRISGLCDEADATGALPRRGPTAPAART